MGAAPRLHESHTASHHDDDHEEAPRKKVEEGEGPWLISYADLMTLLMAFFALLSSISTPDKKAVEKLRQAASEQFGAKLEEPYAAVGSAIKKLIKDKKLEDQVHIEVDINGVQLTFNGTLFFESGEFVVKTGASELMSQLAGILKDQPNKFRNLIEGHTDSVPISHPIIGSNWELSGIRAARIAQIFEAKGFERNSLTIIGWGDSRPVAPDKDKDGNPIAENMAKNRRVVIRVYDPKFSDDPVR